MAWGYSSGTAGGPGVSVTFFRRGIGQDSTRIAFQYCSCLRFAHPQMFGVGQARSVQLSSTLRLDRYLQHSVRPLSEQLISIGKVFQRKSVSQQRR